MDPLPLRDIPGLADYWARATFRAPPAADAHARDTVLRDVLGLGIEQAIAYLATERPELAAFEAWVVATAGQPDPERVARYAAWVAGAPVPERTAARLAQIDAVPPVLDADDRAHWDAHGYVVLRSAITAAEAAEAAALLWRSVAASPDDPASWYAGAGRAARQGIWVQTFQHPTLEVARRSPRVHKAFAQLLGTSDVWATTDRMSFNPPETDQHPFQGANLHWDTSLVAPVPLSVGGILYLTDTSAEQGALRVVPGFHHRLERWLGEIGEADPRGIDLSEEAIAIAGRAGDLVIWRHELPHGASPNRTDRPRLAQYVTMYDPNVTDARPWR